MDEFDELDHVAQVEVQAAALAMVPAVDQAAVLTVQVADLQAVASDESELFAFVAQAVQVVAMAATVQVVVTTVRTKAIDRS